MEDMSVQMFVVENNTDFIYLFIQKCIDYTAKFNGYHPVAI